METRKRWQEVLQHFGLKEREVDVLYLVAADYTISQAGRYLGLAEATIEHYFVNAFQKLGISSRKELARFVIKHNLPVEALRQSIERAAAKNKEP